MEQQVKKIIRAVRHIDECVSPLRAAVTRAECDHGDCSDE